MNARYILFYCGLTMLGPCSRTIAQDNVLSKKIVQGLRNLSQIRTAAEKNDDLEGFLKCYDTLAISMPEYQVTLTGLNEIRSYYREIFQRQNIRTFQRTPTEIIDLGKAIIEIGTFSKEYFRSTSNEKLVIQHGKYWNIWHVQHGRRLKLKGEAFGFFHAIENPEELIIPTNKKQPDESEVYSQKTIPFELKAYNALMEKGVRTRNGILRGNFFTDDGSFMPFADSAVSGIENIRPYLIAYSARGDVTIDSITCYTYDFEYLDEYVIEYDMFKVKWRVPNFAGKTEGKGIRLWRRQEDKSLKLYREIGTHNHIN